MPVTVPRYALAKVSSAMYNAIQQCRDLDGVAANHPTLTDDELSFAVIGAMTMLRRDEVLIDEENSMPIEFPRCRKGHV